MGINTNLVVDKEICIGNVLCEILIHLVKR